MEVSDKRFVLLKIPNHCDFSAGIHGNKLLSPIRELLDDSARIAVVAIINGSAGRQMPLYGKAVIMGQGIQKIGRRQKGFREVGFPERIGFSFNINGPSSEFISILYHNYG
jgi:hypothetical protein